MPFKERKEQRIVGTEIGNIKEIEITYFNPDADVGATKEVITIPENARGVEVRITAIRQRWED